MEEFFFLIMIKYEGTMLLMSVGLKEICFHDLGVICLFSLVILDLMGI